MERAMPTRKVLAYVVQQVHWEYNDEYYFRLEGETGELGDEDSDQTALRTFLSRKKAEAWWRQREEQARGDRNPFDFGALGGDLDDYSNLSPAEFRDRLRAAGLSPPSFGENGRLRDDLAGWWQREVIDMTPEQRSAVWDALDRVRFYEIVETTIDLEE
jgi:hypothetical protein